MSRLRLPVGLVTGIGGTLLDAVMRTVRFETGGDFSFRDQWQARRPVIFALWHGRLVPLSWFHRSWNLATLISASGDGEYIARVVKAWGYEVVRGSSSRGGGQALRQLLRHLRAGRSIAITPDGPRGPREKVKPGVLTAAQLTGFAIVPVSAGAIRAWWAEGWDRFMVPQPFSRIRIHYGRPIFIPRDAGEEELAGIALEVETAINELTRACEADG